MIKAIVSELIAIWGDPLLQPTIAGIVLAAFGGIIGILKDAKREKWWATALLLLSIVWGAYMTVSAAVRQNAESHAELSKSQNDLIGLHADNVYLKNQNAKLERKADATYNAAVNLNNASVRILNGVNQGLTAARLNLKETSSVSSDTRSIASQAKALQASATALQVSALSSLHGIQGLESPLTNISAEYILTITMDDPMLRVLKARLLSVDEDYRKQVSAAKPQNGLLQIPWPIFPIDQILNGMPPTDPGSALLRSMNIVVEIYKPPYRGRPTYRAHQGNKMVAAWDPVDFLIETVGTDGHYAQIGLPVARPGDVSVMITQMGLPTHISRSGRLYSIADLPGSTILIHLLPDFFAVDHPGLLETAHLDELALTIDGARYGIALKEAFVGNAPFFPYYEIRVPKNWRTASNRIP
jgi:hypothetical protein